MPQIEKLNDGRHLSRRREVMRKKSTPKTVTHIKYELWRAIMSATTIGEKNFRQFFSFIVFFYSRRRTYMFLLRVVCERRALRLLFFFSFFYSSSLNMLNPSPHANNWFAYTHLWVVFRRAEWAKQSQLSLCWQERWNKYGHKAHTMMKQQAKLINSKQEKEEIQLTGWSSTTPTEFEEEISLNSFEFTHRALRIAMVLLFENWSKCTKVHTRIGALTAVVMFLWLDFGYFFNHGARCFVFFSTFLTTDNKQKNSMKMQRGKKAIIHNVSLRLVCLIFIPRSEAILPYIFQFLPLDTFLLRFLRSRDSSAIKLHKIHAHARSRPHFHFSQINT